jgi:hypothetical protein
MSDFNGEPPRSDLRIVLRVLVATVVALAVALIIITLAIFSGFGL